MADTDFQISGEIIKADDTLGLVLGWGIICAEKGVPYYDLQGDHIPEDVMMKAAADFMLHSRAAKEMHTGDQIGSIVFSFPLTKDVCEAYGISSDKTGWLVAMRPTADVYAKFKAGEYKGFSIGGRWTSAEDVSDV